MQQLTIRRPDDWHLHLRDGASLAAALPHTARCFGRAVIMPNLSPPVTTVAAARAYRERIASLLPSGAHFTPLMTLYLTDTTTPEEIDRACDSGIVIGCKLYPAGATTHSDAGVTDVRRLEPVWARMSERGLVLQVHGELTDPTVDIFDRESRFVEQVLAPLVQRWPTLRVVLEHVSTRLAVDFVRTARDGVAATITPQHLLLNRNALFQGGLRPHHYCLPVLKRESDRQALLAVVASGHPRFFLGTDSAPHARRAKESGCGCAGVFSAHAAIELYAEVFDSLGALARLEPFACEFGADFYRLPRNQDTITLERRAWPVPSSYPFGADELVPLRAGESVAWSLRP